MSDVDRVRRWVLSDRSIFWFQTYQPAPFRELVAEGLLQEIPKHDGRYGFRPTKALQKLQYPEAFAS
jgi:hypothetical protein